MPWAGGWLASLVFGAPFPGRFILERLYIAHVLVGPTAIAAFVAAHLYLVLRLSHTDYPGPGRSDRLEVGSPAWPDQMARSTSLLFSLFGGIAILSAFFPVEAADGNGPFQPLSSYAPLAPDWFLMWIEGAFRLLPRRRSTCVCSAHPLRTRSTAPSCFRSVTPLCQSSVWRSTGDAFTERARWAWTVGGGRPSTRCPRGEAS